jgi:molecular chaperone DnaK (HSP70)
VVCTRARLLGVCARAFEVVIAFLSFAETERLIGDAAKNQTAMNPENTVFDAKRLIGRRFDDPTVQADMKHWPFKVVNREGNKPHIQVVFKVVTNKAMFCCL